jgi:hyperosmotically inducible periplasmic protein
MNSETSRKIIVAGSMAGAVALGILVVTLRHHPVPQVADATAPPAPTADYSSSPPPAAVQTPEAPPPVASADSLATQSAGSTPPTSAHSVPAQSPRSKPSAAATAAPGLANQQVAVAATAAPAPVTATPASDSAASAEDSPATSATENSSAGAQTTAENTDYAASDHQITADVKSEIALDSATKDSDLAVSTSHGVVFLKGSLPDQNAVAHVVDVVGRVKDVKSVDTSALTVTNL